MLPQLCVELWEVPPWIASSARKVEEMSSKWTCCRLFRFCLLALLSTRPLDHSGCNCGLGVVASRCVTVCFGAVSSGSISVLILCINRSRRISPVAVTDLQELFSYTTNFPPTSSNLDLKKRFFCFNLRVNRFRWSSFRSDSTSLSF